MRRIVYQTCQISRFWQKTETFFQRNPPVFPRQSKVWNFWEFLSKKTIWDAFYKKNANFSHFQIYLAVFRNHKATLPKISSCWTFSDLLGIYIFLKRKLQEKCHVFRLWGKNSIFSKTTSISPNKPKIRLFWKFRSNMNVWHAIPKENAK